MGWLVAAVVVFLIAHQAVEGIVCSAGRVALRRLIWNLATAFLLTLGLGGLWVLVMTVPEYRREYSTVLFLLTPFAGVGIGILAYASKLAYESGQLDEAEEGPDPADS